MTKWWGPDAVDDSELVTLGQVKALLLAGVGSGSGAAARGIEYGETGAIAKLHLALGLINTAAVPLFYAGDSITRGYNTGTTISTNPYVSRFSSRLAADFPKDTGSHPALTVSTTPAAFGTLAAGFNFVNGGISSTNSGNYFTPAMRTAVGAFNPRAVFHNVGTNDYRAFGISPAQFKTNIKAVIADLKAATAGPCVHILVHHHGTLTTSVAPVAAWSDYGDIKRQIAEEDPDNVAFVDLSKAFAAVGVQLGGADPFGFVPDNTHPSDAGHLALGDLLYLAVMGGP